MFYRDLQNDDTIEVCDEVWNPTHRQWFPCWVLAGGTYIGRRVDETGLQWRRLVEGDQPMHESYDPQALSAVREERDRLTRQVDGLKRAFQALIEERDQLSRQLRRVTKERDELATKLLEASTSKELPDYCDETELERRAWELFAHLGSIKPDEAYRQAAEWMAYRDEFRTDSQLTDPADRPRPTSPPPPKVNR